MTVAAVLGREFELSHLRPLIEDTTENQLLDTLEEALGSRIIEELPQAVASYRFTHALIRHTLMDELSTTRRVRLHARIGEALEQLYGDEVEAHAAHLAYHFGEAEAVLGSEKLVRYSILAGEGALDRYAYEEALSHFQRALVATEGQPPIDAGGAALLFGLGRAQGAAGQMHDAWATLDRAFMYYVEVGDVDRAVVVAEHPLHASWHPAGATQLLTHAIELVPSDSRSAGRFLSLQGRVLGVEEGDYDGAQRAFNRAMTIAQREEDSAAEMWTLANAAIVDLNHLRWQETLENSQRAIELAQRNDDPRTEVSASNWAAVAQCMMGDFEEARSRGPAMLVLAEQLRDRTLLASALWINEVTSSLVGDWPAAREFSDRGLAVSPIDARLMGTRVLLEYTLGNLGPGETRLEQLMEVMRVTPRGPGLEYALPALVIPAVCRMTGVGCQFDVAEAAAEAVLTSPSSTPIAALYARIGLALIAVQQGDLGAAEQQHTFLRSQRGTIPICSLMAADRLLGLLAQTIGKLEVAAAHFEDALVLCRKGGGRSELAWSCCDYADMLKDPSTSSGRAAEENQAKATALLDESLAISTELGMRPLMERVLSRREVLGG